MGGKARLGRPRNLADDGFVKLCLNLLALLNRAGGWDRCAAGSTDKEAESEDTNPHEG